MINGFLFRFLCSFGVFIAWQAAFAESQNKNIVLIFKGGNEEARQLCEDSNIALISATGSTQMGKELAPIVSKRLGRTLLELGGNNAAIVCPTADLDLTVK